MMSPDWLGSVQRVMDALGAANRAKMIERGADEAWYKPAEAIRPGAAQSYRFDRRKTVVHTPCIPSPMGGSPRDDWPDVNKCTELFDKQARRFE